MADKRYVRETLVASFLCLRKGLSSKSSLVDRDVDSFSETTVGGNNVTDFEGNHVTGNKISRFDLGPAAIALDFGFGSERIHEGLYCITSITLFVETDSRVDEQQQDDTDKVLPVGCTTFTVGKGDSDESSGFHDPGERIPHETQKLGLIRQIGSEDSQGDNGLGE